MRDRKLKYIGKITINSLRHFILDNSLSGSDEVLLHQINFDEIALEYKETYSTALPVPFVELGILVDEDTEGLVPEGRIRVVQGSNRLDSIYALENNLSEADQVIYRCGYCGNVVDYDGAEFDLKTRSHKISVLVRYQDKINEKHVHGACCPNEDA